MLREKMTNVLAELNEKIAEREELLNSIAIALLTKKNLFILGETGQAKSYAIDEFRKRITNAVQFERLLSKQTDEEQLFGRLDLSSLIPGKLSAAQRKDNKALTLALDNLKLASDAYEVEPNEQNRNVVEHCTADVRVITEAASALCGSKPSVITTGKIPDAHIVFLDEVYKANDGVLNALLKALNERTYTNEGETYTIPTLSFFAASNEMPNFKDPEDCILRPLHDRFDMKVKTEYISQREARQKILRQKQNVIDDTPLNTFSLEELVDMQIEVSSVIIPESINELMDDILVELRSKGVAVSDRKFFGFSPIVQAYTWLQGRTEVLETDLLCLKNYLWNSVEELPVIEQVLTAMCENRLGDAINSFRALAFEAYEAFETENSANSNRALIKFRNEILSVYRDAQAMLSANQSEKDKTQITAFITELGDLNRKANEKTSFTYLTLSELNELDK